MPLLTVFVGNSYRKQLLRPFIQDRTFKQWFSVYVDSEQALNSKSVRKFAYNLLFLCAQTVVISDAEGGPVAKHFVIRKRTHIFWFCWNTANEVLTWDLSVGDTHSRMRLCSVFSDQSVACEQRFGVPAIHLKFPIVESRTSNDSPHYRITYAGEVDVDADWSTCTQLTRRLWQVSERIVYEGMSVMALEDVTVAEAQDFDSVEQNNWIIRNQVRYLFARELKRTFGQDFLLVGTGWQRCGLEAQPDDFDSRRRYRLYAQSRVCIDFLSKSSWEAHYPRSAEIVSHADGLLQLATPSGRQFLGEQYGLRAFRTVDELIEGIEYFSSISASEYRMLGARLRQIARSATRAHNWIATTREV